MTNQIVNRLIDASTESFDINQRGLGETTVLFCNPHTLIALTIQECVKLIQEERQEIESMKVFSTEDKVWNKARTLQCDRLINRLDKLSSEIHVTDDISF